MASFGKIDAFALQTGALARVVTEALRVKDNFTFSGVIPWIDLGTEQVYHKEAVSSYGSTDPAAAASSADITYSNVIPAKTSVYLMNTVVGAQMPIQFMNDPKQMATQLSKKAYKLADVLATRLASTGAATDTNFAGMGSLSDSVNTQTLSGGTLNGSTSGAITVDQVRQLIQTVHGAQDDGKAIVMRPGTYVAFVKAIEALSWSLQVADVAGVRVPLVDGVTPIFINGYIGKGNDCGAAAQLTTRVYCAALNEDLGFAGIFGSGGPALDQNLNAWSGAVRYRLVDDSDSTQVNLQLWAYVNFVLQESTSFAQIVGITDL